MKFVIALALVAAACAAPSADRKINDQNVVDYINSQPGILWKAGMNSRFDGQRTGVLKTLAGVTPESWYAVKALPKAVSTIKDTEVPTSFPGHYPMAYTTPNQCNDKIVN